MDENQSANGLPEMVRPRPGAGGDVPIKTGRRRTLGMKVKSRETFYFLASAGGLGRYSRRFPLTEDGWRDAWRAFATEDPDAAQAYRDAQMAPPGATGGPGQAPGPSYGGGAAGNDHLGWAYIFAGGLGSLLAALLINQAGADASPAEAVFGVGIGFLSFALAMIGVIAEGILLARSSS